MGIRDNDCGQVWTSDTGGVFKAENLSEKVIFLFAIARLVKAGSIVSTVYISICLKNKKKNKNKKFS